MRDSAARTILLGWQRYKNHPDRRIRARFAWEARDLAATYAGALWAARHWFRRDRTLSAKVARVLKDIHCGFGLKSRLAAPLVGRYVRFMMAREDRRLRRGWTYEPPTFCEANQIVAAGSTG